MLDVVWVRPLSGTLALCPRAEGFHMTSWPKQALQMLGSAHCLGQVALREGLGGEGMERQAWQSSV